MVIISIVVIGCSAINQPDILEEPVDEAGPILAATSTEIKASATPLIAATSSKTAEPPTPDISPTHTQVPTIPPTEEIPATETPTSVPRDLALFPDGIWLYPVPSIYEGDLVTIQINPTVPEGMAPNDVDVSVLLDGEEIVSGNLNWRNLNGDASGLFQWVWDTDQSAGEHTLKAIVDPDDKIQIGDEDAGNNQAELTVIIRPTTGLPDLEANAAWVTVANNCCNIHVVSGTAAHRDLEYLIEQVDLAFSQASSALEEPLKDTYDVFLIDRVIGQGGYASNSMVVSYLDRDYAGSGIYEVLVHEAVHLIDRQFAPDRISFLSEGLAVWATGGHYRQENINQKMAGVVEGGLYVPIDIVADQIYSLQHEISYLEAASFLGYLIDRYDWDRVRAFYIDTGSDDAPTLAEAVNKNLKIHFDKTLSQIETDWMNSLSSQPRDRTAVSNLRTTIRYYDVMRDYQQEYDPSAYYLYAWLPPPLEAKEKEATADLTRHPETSANIALEVILLSAKEALVEGNYRRANAYLDSVERVLDNGGRFLDPLADSYLNIVRTARSNGYEVQQVNLLGNQAEVLATRYGELEITELTLELVDSSTWVLMR
ncbi:MAG: hypothetical protein BMS9Abin02_0398 [Anaerolineae bacterium]|nr:MAG: hypothetical protein BMS9Abin02_0398 [Anaerolineae bacterium]